MPHPVFYLHGFASGPGSKKAGYMRDRLGKAGVELQIPDLAQGGFEGLTVTGQLGVVERLAGGRPVSLIGSSLGGYVAALYAARHPEVRRVLLLAPAFGFARRFTETLGPAELAEWRRTGWLPVYNYAEGRQSRVGYGLIEDAERYEEYPEVTQATLVFHGTRDDVVPFGHSQEFASRRRNVRLELVDSDHEMLSMLDRIGLEGEKFLTEK